MHSLNQVFDSKVAFIASFLTVVDKSRNHDVTGLFFSVIFVKFGVELTNNRESILFHKVKWQHYLSEVNCRRSSSCR